MQCAAHDVPLPLRTEHLGEQCHRFPCFPSVSIGYVLLNLYALARAMARDMERIWLVNRVGRCVAIRTTCHPIPIPEPARDQTICFRTSKFHLFPQQPPPPPCQRPRPPPIRRHSALPAACAWPGGDAPAFPDTPSSPAAALVPFPPSQKV
jgi:hypothetical protein